MNIINEFREKIFSSIAKLEEDGVIPKGFDYSGVVVEFCKDPKHGFIATNAAMIIAAQLNKQSNTAGTSA